jgi:kynureninase
MTTTFSPDEGFALQLDAEDSLRGFREKFHVPLGKNGKPLIYLAGNSLGLMPKTARKIVEQELDDWANLAVDAHLDATTPWYSYHETLREPTARLVGAKPNEVVCMNSLTVNLHLMMATFYRPTKSRNKILMEDPAFPSDMYAIKTQIAHHGFDPKEKLILARPREGEFAVRQDDIEAALEKHGDQIALVLMAGVNFFTGQLFDIEKITTAAQTRGITVATCHSRCMIGTSISQYGAHISISTPAPARRPERSCTSGTRPIAACRGWPVGGATIRRPGSACSSNRNSYRCRRPTPGLSAIHPSCRWRRCARRCRFLMKPAG